ncbi:MAG: LytR/AlgR family response regulator transcription factor, partial [Planctomycetota bacterium]
EGPAPGRARLEELLEERGEERLVIQREGAMVMVPFEEILWVEAADQYVKIHGADGRTELMRASMAHVEKRLPAEDFLRVHRSAIIRRQAVRDLWDRAPDPGGRNHGAGESHPHGAGPQDPPLMAWATAVALYIAGTGPRGIRARPLPPEHGRA